MSNIELQTLIGKPVSVKLENLIVNCKIMDAKHAYGHPRILVSPTSGYGLQWVNLDRMIGGTHD